MEIKFNSFLGLPDIALVLKSQNIIANKVMTMYDVAIAECMREIIGNREAIE